MSEFYHPKSEWGDGPWQNEPDEDQGTIDTPYIKLKARLIRNASGAWCGYVGVPPGHPLHGRGYSDGDDYTSSLDSQFRVHGGLTYAGLRADDDDWWYFGFDCSHAWDYSPCLTIATGRERDYSETYRTIEYVREQCDQLGQQIAEHEKGLIARFVAFLMGDKVQ